MDWAELNSIPGTLPKPGKRVKEKKPPKPRKPLKKRNANRARVSNAEAFSVQAQACHSLPCYACGSWAGSSQAHHEPTRAAGGTDRDCIPLCPVCHQRRHDIGAVTFWDELGKTPEMAKDHVRTQAGITIYG